MSGISGLFLIVRRSLRQHLLSTCVTAGSVALACGLVMAVFSINTQTRRAFTGGPVGFDAVLGARGSELQLVLNTVFHLETSPGNIPWKLYQAMRENPLVEQAIPYAVGDNYLGYRIVGTTEELFMKFEYQEGKRFEIEPGGRVFDLRRREAVVGSFVAQKTGLKLNDYFHPYHDLVFNPAQKHNERYRVVGILGPTNSPSDRVIWIPIEGIFRLGGHVLRGSGEGYEAQAGQSIPDEHKEVSAVMLKVKGAQAGFALANKINRQGNVATLAFPVGRVMAELFNKLGWVHRVLTLVAYLVVVVAAASILASIYNTMNERRREFAILRALGARRSTVFSVIILEAGAVAAVGCALGYVVYAGILLAATAVLRTQTGVVLAWWQSHDVLYLAPLGMMGLGILAGVAPALKAYATDVATHLTPSS